MRKGIILAGGSGTSLYPWTRRVSKQPMPVYDKPMIYSPLSLLMLADVRDIMIAATPHDQVAFREVLGDESEWGLSLRYAVQPKSEGLAQAFHIASDFVGTVSPALVWGDNIFHGHGLTDLQAAAAARKEGATVFGHHIADRTAHGVVSLDADGKAETIKEKPAHPRSSYAVTSPSLHDGRTVSALPRSESAVGLNLGPWRCAARHPQPRLAAGRRPWRRGRGGSPGAEDPSRCPAYVLLDKSTTRAVLEAPPPHWRIALRPMPKELQNRG